MTQLSGPFPLAGGGTVEVPVPQGVWRRAVVANIGPLNLSVQQGPTGPVWLPQNVQDIYLTDATRAPLVIGAPAQPATLTGTALVTWYAPDEAPGGVYPSALPSTTVTINNATVQVTPATPNSLALSEKIAITGGVQALPNVPLKVGVAFLADPKNSGPIFVADAGVSAASAYLPPGLGVVLPGSNAGIFSVEGTSGDNLSVWGQ